MSPRPNHLPDHPVASPKAAFRAQLALLLSRPRLGFLLAMSYLLLQALTLAAAGFLVGVQIAFDGESVTVSLPRLSGMNVHETLGAWAWAAGALLLTGIFFTGRVWRGVRGEQRLYHWAMPIDRRRHDLLKIAAGSLALAVISVFFLLATVAAAVVSGHGSDLGRFSPAAWVTVLLGPQLLYLLSSALVAAGRQRRWWLLAGALVWAGLLSVPGMLEGKAYLMALGEVFWGPFGLLPAVAGPTLEVVLAGTAEVPGPWLPAFILWAFFALVCLAAATSARRGAG